ncbi:hypothetical protein SxD43FB_06625 [Sphingobium sp. D43FB]|nr:hypothetical protein SxD43FB_06625 [Sphingobium sp. D43FB]
MSKPSPERSEGTSLRSVEPFDRLRANGVMISNIIPPPPQIRRRGPVRPSIAASSGWRGRWRW